MSETPPEFPARDTLAAVEDLPDGDESALTEARSLIRDWLRSRSGTEQQGASIGDALAELARNPGSDRTAIIATLRFMAVPNLLPAENNSNQIARSVVSLAESNLPELCSFLKIEAKSQNYEKFAALGSAHSKVMDILSPIAERYSDIDALIKGRNAILGALNHSIVRIYGEPFKVADVRNALEGVFGRLKRVAGLEDSFLQDYEDCRRSVSDARNVAAENRSFIAKEFLSIFLDNTENLLRSFLDTVRARFHTEVTWGGASAQLQKRLSSS